MRMLAFMPVGAEPVFVSDRAILDFEQERRPAIPVPQLRRVDLVPARHLTRREQEQDSG